MTARLVLAKFHVSVRHLFYRSQIKEQDLHYFLKSSSILHVYFVLVHFLRILNLQFNIIQTHDCILFHYFFVL